METMIKNATIEQLMELNAPILAKLNNGELLSEEEWKLQDMILEAATRLLDAQRAADAAAYIAAHE